ncbi:MAG: sulfatase-like hydrolase/transferase [Acidimicrobiales bacterium]
MGEPTVEGAPGRRRPNILFVVSDQERQRDWLPPDVHLPHRQRLIDEGLEFTNYHTHSSPCSPSRASIMTGQYVPHHGVNENVIHPFHRQLDPAVPTLGHALRDQGYTTAYLGKWHLSHSPQPDMEAYGYGDWTGNDRQFMGWAGTGVAFDPDIAGQAARWLGAHGQDTEPWFLTVGLVNPHDVMWFPIDQPWYQQAHPEETARAKRFLDAAKWKESDSIPAYEGTCEPVNEQLPSNFDDDLHTKPAVQRQWLHEQQHAWYGTIDRHDEPTWLRHLDYYVALHRDGDRNLGLILDALDATGRADDTIVIFTSDHGDMCGSHGLRSKGPFVYDEIMRVPLYVRVPGLTRAGAKTAALATHVDLATTIALLGGAGRDDLATFRGEDLTPVLADPSTSVRSHVLFAQDTAWYESCINLRYAIRGMYDGRFKYARYYGVGGGSTPFGVQWPTPKRFDVDADFEDHDHELYDRVEDPDELVNLAMDRSRRSEVRDRFAQLLQLETAAGFFTN